ncbi:MAG: OB-fold domain-containing protein [Acidobacteriia bacterium]|nr:OB-fold domain-containing protein [Terriglobia bacterium]
MSEAHWIVKQKIDIPFQYTPGPALLRFLEGLRGAQLLASGVPGEARKTIPPLSFCGRAWKPADEWTELPGTGVLESFAVVPRAMAELPEAGARVVFGLVKLDGAETRLVHLVRAAQDADLRVGARVKVLWNPARSAAIRDIAGFEVIT